MRKLTHDLFSALKSASSSDSTSCVSLRMSWPTVELPLSSGGGGGGISPSGGGIDPLAALVEVVLPVALVALAAPVESVDEVELLPLVDEVPDRPSWLRACSIACMKSPPPPCRWRRTGVVLVASSVELVALVLVDETALVV
jgi:hypothetical protein